MNKKSPLMWILGAEWIGRRPIMRREERLKELLSPAVFGQWWYGRLLGRRDRVLTLPVMVSDLNAAVASGALGG